MPVADRIKVEKKDSKETKTISYSEKEKKFLSKWIVRLADARDARDGNHDEFDGMNYIQYCEMNRKGANTFIEPKKNREDTTLVTGTTRQKILAYLSALNNLNITGEVEAYNDQDIQDLDMGHALDDVIEKTRILEGDEENKMLRQYTLLEQGTVFVEELWTERWERRKVLPGGKTFDGKIADMEWIDRLVKVSDGPQRNILQNENVYLGDITIFGVQKQPFIFTVKIVPYGEAEEIFGEWDRWEYVSRDLKNFSTSTVNTTYNNNWTLTQIRKGHCEIVCFQDRYSNEFGYIVNGILMTPVGMPIPWNWGDEIKYNLEMQIHEIISPKFAYGKSVVARFRTKQALYDEMMRLAVLKTQKSFIPPYSNMTGLVLSSRIFFPGKMNSGIDAEKLKPLGDTNGVSRSEMAFIQELQRQIDDDSVLPVLQGKGTPGASRMTATQSQHLKQQAELMLTLTIFSATMLEQKIDTLRLYNVLENYFDPIGKKFDETKKKLVDKYRTANVPKMIEGEGAGQSIVRVSDTQVDPMQVFNEEENIKKTTGVPTRINHINRDLIKSVRYSFYVRGVQKEKKTSNLARVLFGEMIQGAAFAQEDLNKEYLEERYAQVWGENPSKMWKKAQQAPGTPGADGAPDAGGGVGPANPNGARGSVMPKSMTRAGQPMKPSVNTLES